MANPEETTVNFDVVIPIGGQEVFDLNQFGLEDDNNTAVDKLSPFKNITAYNNGSVDLQIFINQGKGYEPLPAGTILGKTDKKISFIRIKNTSAVTAGNVVLALNNEVSDHELLKRISEKRT